MHSSCTSLFNPNLNNSSAQLHPQPSPTHPPTTITTNQGIKIYQWQNTELTFLIQWDLHKYLIVRRPLNNWNIMNFLDKQWMKKSSIVGIHRTLYFLQCSIVLIFYSVQLYWRAKSRDRVSNTTEDKTTSNYYYAYFCSYKAISVSFKI